MLKYQFTCSRVFKGFCTERRDHRDGAIYEIHWAVYPDGRIYASLDIPAPTPYFGRTRANRPTHWARADALPTDAEFIGNYYQLPKHI